MLMFVPGGCSDKEWPLAFDHDFLCFGHTILFLLDSYRVYANFQHCLSVSDMEVIRRKEEKAYVTGYALRRDVKGKEQRVFVLGDADCISNGELWANREFRRSNYALTDGMFRWLVYDEYPIDVSRPAAKDNDTYLTPGGFAWIKIFLRWICPVLIVVCGCVIWVMRRMK